MKPSNENSAPKSGTLFSLEQSQASAISMETKYRSWLGERYFEITSRTDGPVVTITITLRTADKSYVYPIEGRIHCADNDLKPAEARDLLLDFMDAYVEEYLTGGEDTYLTIDWSNYECDGVDIQLRGQILNLKLEELAESIINGSQLTH